MFVFLSAAFFLISNSRLHAQDSVEVPKLTLNLSYFGNNIWNPGFNGGLDFTHGVENGETRKGGDYTRQKFINLDMGFFVDPGSHAGLLVHSGFNHRKYQKGKLNLHLGGSPLGLFRTFPFDNEGKNATEESSESPISSRFYYAPTLSLGVGKFRNSIPGTGWFFTIDITSMIPNRNYVMFLVNTRLGVRVRLS
jgi:hypothetical protein